MLHFNTQVSRGVISTDDMTDEQLCIINVFGAAGAAISIGVPKVETDEELQQFMSRVRFWERFCPLANSFDEEKNEFVPFPIPEDAVRSLMPITTNVSRVTKTQFIKNIVSTYGNVE